MLFWSVYQQAEDWKGQSLVVKNLESLICEQNDNQ